MQFTFIGGNPTEKASTAARLAGAFRCLWRNLRRFRDHRRDWAANSSKYSYKATMLVLIRRSSLRPKLCLETILSILAVAIRQITTTPRQESCLHHTQPSYPSQTYKEPHRALTHRRRNPETELLWSHPSPCSMCFAYQPTAHRSTSSNSKKSKSATRLRDVPIPALSTPKAQIEKHDSTTYVEFREGGEMSEEARGEVKFLFQARTFCFFGRKINTYAALSSRIC